MHGAVALAQRPKERRRDPRRRAAVDIALSLADLNAGLGDYDRALEHLSAADQLTGGALAARFRDQRESWLEQAAAAPVWLELPSPQRRSPAHPSEWAAAGADRRLDPGSPPAAPALR